MFNMNIYMKTNFLKTLNRINNCVIFNSNSLQNISSNNFLLNKSLKNYSSIIKRKGKGDWNFVFSTAGKSKKEFSRV
jgi:hypothetical protein